MTKMIYQLILVLIFAAMPAFSAESTISFDNSDGDIHKTITQITGSIADSPLLILPSELDNTDTEVMVEDNRSGLMKTGFRILNEAGTWVPMPVETDETGKRYTTMPTMPNSQPKKLEYWVTCPVPSNYTWHVCLKYETDVSISGHQHNAPSLPITGNPPCVSNIPGGKKISWYFKVPVYSGKIKFTAKTSGACVGPVSTTLTVMIQNLMYMPAGWGYELVGSTPTHPNNHYGKLNNITSLQNIAREYKTAFPKDTNLLYNDMSLTWGGLFDIDDNWQSVPRGHKEHRLGNHVDIQMTTIPSNHRKQFINIACKYAYAYLEHKTSYHLSFANSYSKDYKVEELPENSKYYKALCPKR